MMGKKHLAWHVPAATLWLAFATAAFAEEQTQGVEIDFDRIVHASSWLDQNVFGLEGQTIGVAKDLAFDLETGHLALVLVKLSGLDESRAGYLAIPPVALTQFDKGLRIQPNVRDWRLASSRRLPSAAYHMQLNRGWAEEQYKVFQQQPYWVRPVKAENEQLKQKVQPEKKDKDYMLVLASQLKQVPVHDQDGEQIGQLRGFAVSPRHGRIAYAALRLTKDENKLYPVPLGAFVVEEVPGPWQIKLDAQVVANSPSFEVGNWPSKIERGWIEYVHVRYGRSAIGGVQQSEQPQRTQREQKQNNEN